MTPVATSCPNIGAPGGAGWTPFLPELAETYAPFGYVSGAERQPYTAVPGIRTVAGIAPGVLFIGAVGLTLKYDLTEDHHVELVAEIHERRAAASMAAAPEATV